MKVLHTYVKKDSGKSDDNIFIAVVKIPIGLFKSQIKVIRYTNKTPSKYLDDETGEVFYATLFDDMTLIPHLLLAALRMYGVHRFESYKPYIEETLASRAARLGVDPVKYADVTGIKPKEKSNGGMLI